jgi:mevalonate kinase
MSLRKFPAKVLLLGEYTILNGSKALALPYNTFSGQWSFEDNGTELRIESQKSLKDFLKNQCSDYIDLNRFAKDLENGLWFDSSIPQGFGLGSSGALIAGIYNAYSLREKEDVTAQSILARLEDYFHGSSSGLDPLVSHVERPLLIHNFSEVEVIHQPLKLDHFFLLNTGKPRQTGALVAIYQEKLKDPQFKQSCANVLSKEVNFAIDAVITSKVENLSHHLWLISKFQWDFFPEMIPTQVRGIWSHGLETGDYVLKLCGAGGGGYLLGYSEKYNLDQMRAKIEAHELRSLT